MQTTERTADEQADFTGTPQQRLNAYEKRIESILKEINTIDAEVLDIYEQASGPRWEWAAPVTFEDMNQRILARHAKRIRQVSTAMRNAGYV